MASSDLPEVDTGHTGADDGAHLDNFVMPDASAREDPDPEAPQEVGEDGEVLGAEPEMMDRETFWFSFKLIFSLPGSIMPELKPLDIQPQEVEAAHDCADACYDLLRIWYPAALRPGNETIGLLIKAAPFIIAKVAVVRIILANRARNAQGAVEGAGKAKAGQGAQKAQEDATPAPYEGTGPLMFDGVPGAAHGG